MPRYGLLHVKADAMLSSAHTGYGGFRLVKHGESVWTTDYPEIAEYVRRFGDSYSQNTSQDIPACLFSPKALQVLRLSTGSSGAGIPVYPTLPSVEEVLAAQQLPVYSTLISSGMINPKLYHYSPQELLEFLVGTHSAVVT